MQVHWKVFLPTLYFLVLNTYWTPIAWSFQKKFLIYVIENVENVIKKIFVTLCHTSFEHWFYVIKCWTNTTRQSFDERLWLNYKIKSNVNETKLYLNIEAYVIWLSLTSVNFKMFSFSRSYFVKKVNVRSDCIFGTKIKERPMTGRCPPLHFQAKCSHCAIFLHVKLPVIMFIFNCSDCFFLFFRMAFAKFANIHYTYTRILTPKWECKASAINRHFE